MKLNIEIGEEDLKRLVLVHLRDTLGAVDLKIEDIKIEVKSVQNYKSEWETALFRARLEKHT